MFPSMSFCLSPAGSHMSFLVLIHKFKQDSTEKSELPEPQSSKWHRSGGAGAHTLPTAYGQQTANSFNKPTSLPNTEKHFSLYFIKCKSYRNIEDMFLTLLSNYVYY